MSDIYPPRWTSWPAARSTAWLLWVAAGESDAGFERLVQEVYAEALRRLAAWEWERLPVVLYDPGPAVREDLRPLALEVWPYNDWLVNALPVAVEDVLLGRSSTPSLDLAVEDGRLAARWRPVYRIGTFWRRSPQVARLPQPRRGRPPRWASREEFLRALSPLVRHIVARGDYPSAERLANEAVERGLLPREAVDPARVLKEKRREFGF